MSYLRFEKALMRVKLADPSRVTNFDDLPFSPVPVKAFLRRLPFYFYVADENMEMPLTADFFIGAAIAKSTQTANKKEKYETAEKVYEAIEDVFTNYGITAEQLFAYFTFSTGSLDPVDFMEWYHYLTLCKKSHDTDYLPDKFRYSYNAAREKAGLEPIIYCIKGYSRSGKTISFAGEFPVDPEGQPVLRWIDIILKNPGRIICTPHACYKETYMMEIEITPKTELYARNAFRDVSFEKDSWYRLYTGPLAMEFEPEMLKKNRKKMKMTQREVAEAIGTTLRTYQSWEAGVTIPDSLHLLRLMNWLDISDPVTITKCKSDWNTES